MSEPKPDADEQLLASNQAEQTDLFGPTDEDEDSDFAAPEPTPAQVWDLGATKRALDELFSLTQQYRSSAAYHDLLQFIARFRFYSAFNAMLIHLQMPGARFALPPHRWAWQYGRHIKEGARPLVILRPMGPVMFVFDASQTEGRELPEQVVKPLEPRGGRVGRQLERTIENAKRDGVAVHTALLGSQRGGSVCLVTARPGKVVVFRETDIPIRFELELSESASRESRYATLVHELGHLYCGHLGIPDKGRWPNRYGLPHSVREFEAESVAYLLCGRLGIENPSAEYLAGYVRDHDQVPPISLECVMKSAGLIERMGQETLSLRE